MRRFDLLIFDWDGTLADSAALIVGSMQNAIRDLNLPPRDDREIANLIGLGLMEGVRRLFPEMEPEEAFSLLRSYRNRFVGNGQNEAPLFRGAQVALAELAAQDYVLAVATGKSRAGLNRALRHHGAIRPLFTATRTADETANKPDPLMLRELMEDCGVPVARALMIGDTEYDAEMARAIGMPMVGVTSGVHEPTRLLDAGAEALIETVADLPSWLGG